MGWCYCVLFGKRYCHQIETISVVKNGNVGLLLAALAIISRTCIFLLELGIMVGFALVLLGLAFFWSEKGATFSVLKLCF